MRSSSSSLSSPALALFNASSHFVLSIAVCMAVGLVACAVATSSTSTGDSSVDPLDTSAIRVDPTTQFFVDTHRRVRIFHGVNAVYKVPPYYPVHSSGSFLPQDSLSDVDLHNLSQWGFNVVRLYVAWPGVMPDASWTVDETYLDNIQQIVDTMRQFGVYALLDNHQDLISRYFCGEGMPDWLAKQNLPVVRYNFPQPWAKDIPKDPSTQYPLVQECLKRPFGMYYVTQAVESTFQMLYENRSNSQGALNHMWSAVARRFAEADNVLGYELINEPAIGDFYSHPSLLLEPGKTDRQYLAPMYKALFQTIQQQDPNHIVFYEPCVFDLLETGLPAGGIAPSAQFADRQAMSYHAYCFDVNKRGEPQSGLLCDLDDKALISSRVKEGKRKRLGGMMLTEFGALSNATSSLEEIARVAGEADAWMQSWAYWQFKKYEDFTTAAQPATTESFYDENGNLEEDKVKALSRTYPQAIAGVPLSYQMDPKTGAFTMKFSPDVTIQQAPTVVYVNRPMWYPKGLKVSVLPQGALQWSDDGSNWLQFFFTASSASVKEIQISISAL